MVSFNGVEVSNFPAVDDIDHGIIDKNIQHFLEKVSNGATSPRLHINVKEYDKGGLKKPGGAYLMIGIAANELRDWQQAMDALKEAKRFDDKTRRQADDWMNFVQDRIAVARG